MNIVKQRKNGKTYIYIRESYWDPVRKKYSSRNVKSYGDLDLLLAQNPNFLEELQNEMDHLRDDRSNEKQRRVAQRAKDIKLSFSQDFASDTDNPSSMLGPYVYKRIWDQLALPRKLRDLQKAQNVSFDLAGAAFFMTTARSLAPDSKLAQWQKRNQIFASADGLKLQHTYRTLDILEQNKSDLVRYLNKQISKQYHRVVSVALYDVTTYYFESQHTDTLRNFGFSKDNKVNQVQVVMGLLIDDQAVPIDYELFAGNQNEFGTMIPILQKLKDEYKIRKVIVSADRGLNSASNLLAIKQLGMEYVIAYRLRGSGLKYRDLILDSEGWRSWTSNGVHSDIKKYRITDEVRSIKTESGTVTLKSKLLINYSESRARKDAMDRERLVGKAQKLADNPSILKSELKRGGKSFLHFDSAKLVAHIDEERIQESSFWDGYYGIVYSDPHMSVSEVMNVHHSLWQIEESFRISKSILVARPCFHWTEKRIRGHFFICYLALVLHRLLEVHLQRQGIQMSAERIVEALRLARVTEVALSANEVVYCKSNTEGDFDVISRAIGLGTIARICKATELKQALRVKKL